MKQKLQFAMVAMLMISSSLYAKVSKDSIWTTDGNIGVKFTQVSLTNWAAGGNNAVAFDVQGAYQANLKKGKHIWNSRIELAYGLNKNKGEGTQKSNDKIYINTNYGYELAKHLYFST